MQIDRDDMEELGGGAKQRDRTDSFKTDADMRSGVDKSARDKSIGAKSHKTVSINDSYHSSKQEETEQNVAP